MSISHRRNDHTIRMLATELALELRAGRYEDNKEAFDMLSHEIWAAGLDLHAQKHPEVTLNGKQ